MKITSKYTLSLVISIMLLSGCFPTPLSITQATSSTAENSVRTETTLPDTPQPLPPTLDLPLLLTPHVTPFPTRPYAEASEDVADMLKTNGDCKFPCFWGIHPDITGYDELYSVIDYLGGYRYETSDASNQINVFTSFRLEKNDGVRVEFAAVLQDDIVKNMKIGLLNLYSSEVSLEDWPAYNLDKVQSIYGPPDGVELGFAQISNAIWFVVTLKYETVSTVIEFTAGAPEGDKYSTPDSVLFCPKEISFDTVTLYLGNYPFNTIPSGLPLLKGTGLTEQEFHKLFTDNPSACLILNRKAFYP